MKCINGLAIKDIILDRRNKQNGMIYSFPRGMEMASKTFKKHNNTNECV